MTVATLIQRPERKVCKKCGKKKYIHFMTLKKLKGWKKEKIVCIDCSEDGRSPRQLRF